MTDPVDDALDYKQKEAAARNQKDLELRQNWIEGGKKPEDLKPLLQRYNPLFTRKTKEWKAPAVNPAAFKAELQKHFINALEDYDPNRGAALNTYVQQRLMKSQRFNTRYQNVAYIPEGKTRLIGPIQVAQGELTEELGRPPNSMELSERINTNMTVGKPVTPKKIESVLSSIRKDIPESVFESDPLGSAGSREQDVLGMMKKNPSLYFTPEEAKVFEHVYGVNRQQVNSTGQLANLLGTSPSKVSRLKTSIGEKIKKHL